MLCFMLNILLLIMGNGFCYDFEIVNFHDYCGKTITKYVGELRFDAQKFPSYLPENKCRVIIKPQSALFNSQTHVLFYFTKFDGSTLCTDTNITITDGTPDRGTHLNGLPFFLCGHNRTLENPDSVFTTKSDKLTVTFKRANYISDVYGKFSMKYVQFSAGACGGQGIYSCTNGRCIPTLYHCSVDINPCGEEQADCSNDEEAATSNSDKMLEILQNLLGLAVMLFGIVIFITLYRKYRKGFHCPRRNSENESRSSSFLLECTEQIDPWPTDQIPLTTTEEQQDTRHVSDNEIEINTYNPSNSRNSFCEPGNNEFNVVCNDISSRYADLSSSGSHQLNTSGPPPSYDDVIVNQNYGR